MGKWIQSCQEFLRMHMEPSQSHLSEHEEARVNLPTSVSCWVKIAPTRVNFPHLWADFGIGSNSVV